jgi:hypothetical protein
LGSWVVVCGWTEMGICGVASAWASEVAGSVGMAAEVVVVAGVLYVFVGRGGSAAEVEGVVVEVGRGGANAGAAACGSTAVG